MNEHLRMQSVTHKPKAIYIYRLSRVRRTTETNFKLIFQQIAPLPEITDRIIADANKPLTMPSNNKKQLALLTKNLITLIQIMLENQTLQF